MSLPVLNTGDLLDSAERELLVEGKSEFLFTVRKKSGCDNFYGRLEQELREQDLFSIAEFRSVREGRVKVSRPSLLRIDRETLLRHRPHLLLLERELVRWRSEFASLRIEEAIRHSYRELFAEPVLTRACLEVLNHLIQHRDEIKGLLPRQIQHSNSTKLIGREPLLLRVFGIWRGQSASWSEFLRYFELEEKPVEFRFFAPICRFQNMPLRSFHGILSSEWVQDYTFQESAGTLIVENLETFYSEVAKTHNRIILWGAGWRASLLRRFHQQLPRPILYWGDIDKEGYEIYGHLKSFVPDLTPTLMDRHTIDRHLQFSTKKEQFLGPYRFVGDLQGEYQEICQRGLCIEQEKIHDRPY